MLPDGAFSRTAELFRPGMKVALCGHRNPDGDALGSSVAMTLWLEGIGCDVVQLLADGPDAPELYSFLAGYDFTAAADYHGTPDLFVALDLSTPSRLGAAEAVLKRSPRSLVIDHHRGYDGFADQALSSPEAAACGLIVWQLIGHAGYLRSRQMAEACYVALITDTGRFAFQNTDEEALLAAAEMVAAGAHPALISSLIYDQRSPGAMALEAKVIERMRLLFDGKVVCSWLDDHDLAAFLVEKDETEGLPTLLRSLKGVEVAILLRKEGGKVRANLRAKGGFDVAAIAKGFGGGGHTAAAGFTFAGSLEAVIEAVSEKLAATAIGTTSQQPLSVSDSVVSSGPALAANCTEAQ
ncbi:MAG: DHH family phosphoesterase [Actinomycetia bacterium]|nr:DHH family phosphoesterase [Actinomycetes bacterium]